MADQDELIDRLGRARRRLAALQPQVEAGAPWRLSANFGVAPEARWYPPEVLAHVAEMLGYWQGEVERVLTGAAQGEAPVPFGRIQSDAGRIEAIGRDRTVPIRDLFGRIDAGIGHVADRIRTLSDSEWQARGLHPTRGELTVGDVFDRFAVTHLEEHIDQLDEILATTQA